MASQDRAIIQLRGIVVGQNPHDVPPGSMHIASENLVLRQQSLLEVRRGIAQALKQRAYDKLLQFGDLLLLHTVGGALEVAAPPFTSSTLLGGVSMFSPNLDQLNRWRPRGVTAGGRFFITRDGRPAALDEATTSVVPREAGAPIATSITAVTLSGAGTAINPGQRVAYRYVIGRVLPNGVQVLGAPSGRFIFTNSAGSIQDTILSLALPAGLDERFFIQVYRSNEVDTGIQPDDDLQLVYERAITGAEAAAGLVTFTDVVPPTLRGEYIYTAPNSGEGAASANLPPPQADEVALFKERLWLARTRQPCELFFRIMAVGGTAGIQSGDVLVFTGFTSPIVLEAGVDYALVTAGSASSNIELTAQNLVAAINTSAGGNGDLWAEYVSGPDSVPGEIRLYGRAPSTAAFTMWVDQNSGGGAWSRRDAFSPRPLPLLTGNASTLTFTLTRVANVVTATLSAGALSPALTVGERIVLTNPPTGFDAGPHIITSIGGSSFLYAEVAPDDGPHAGVVAQVYDSTTGESTQETHLHRLHWSKPDEFEAFPAFNFVDVGRSDREIIAIVPTREVMWVFKQDGLFRISGDDEDTFSVERVDATCVALAPELVVPFAEKVVAFTTKGIVMISESSFDVLSGDVDELLRNWQVGERTASLPPYGLLYQAFMVVDERESLLRVHLPGSSINESENYDGAGEALVFSMVTQSWHRWAWSVPGNEQFNRPLRHGLTFSSPTFYGVVYGDAYFDGASEGFIWTERGPNSSDRYDDDNLAAPADKVAVRHRAVWAANDAGAPGRLKRWDEVAILALPTDFTSTQAAFRYGYWNELTLRTGANFRPFGVPPDQADVADATTYATESTDPPKIRLGVSIDYRQSELLWVIVTQEVVGSAFVCRGLEIKAEVLNEKVSR